MEAMPRKFLSTRESHNPYLEYIKGEPESVEFLRVRNSIDLYAGLIEIFVMTGRSYLILLGEFLVSYAALDQLIKHVIITFLRTLKGDTALLQQVILNDASLDHPF